jgi:hypothetical protein
MGYFINVFFVDKLFFTAESRSTAWPCNVELPQPSSKEYDSEYSDDDDDDDDNEMDELSQKNLKREIRWNHFDHNKQMMQV